MPPRRRIMPLVLGLPVRQAYAFTGICSSIPKNLRFFGSPVSAAQVFSSFPKSLTTFREPCAAHWNGLRSVPIFVCAKISHPLRRRIMPLVLGLPVRQAYAFTGICSSIPKNLRFFGSPARPGTGGSILIKALATLPPHRRTMPFPLALPVGKASLLRAYAPFPKKSYDFSGALPTTALGATPPPLQKAECKHGRLP